MRLERTALAFSLLLAACGRQDAPPSQDETTSEEAPAAVAETAQEAEPAETTAADEFGPLAGKPVGIAFWAHPRLAFQGLVIAATGKGVEAFNIENGAKVFSDDGFSAGGVSLAYLGSGESAQAYAAFSLAGDEPGYRVYAVDNESRALSLLDTMFVTDRQARGFCLGRNRNGERLALHEMRDDGWRTTPLAIAERMVTAGEPTTGRRRGGFERCVVDDLDGAVFALAGDGALYRIPEGGDPERLADTRIENAAGIGLALNGLVEGGDTAECCGQIAVLDGGQGVVRLFDREDGSDLGAMRLGASFDVEAVEEASAMGLAYGNFGAVYRDGMLALGVDGEEPVLRIAPMIGVMDSLDQRLGPTADPRDLSPEDDEDDPTVIDVDPVVP